MTYLMVERRNPRFGSIGFPFPSSGFDISKTVRIVAIAIQTVSIAIFFPEHDLVINVDVSESTETATTFTNRLP